MTGEKMTEQRVRFTVEIDGRVVVVENVPARVDAETGEQLFSPATVERLQEIVWSGRIPDRVEETPVFDFNG
jgi:YgiT-type zinc finger domain-containing protein